MTIFYSVFANSALSYLNTKAIDSINKIIISSDMDTQYEANYKGFIRRFIVLFIHWASQNDDSSCIWAWISNDFQDSNYNFLND